MICFSIISFYISVFGLALLTTPVKLVPLQPHGCKYLLLKALKAFFQPLAANNNFCQSLTALQNFNPAVNYKPYTWSPVRGIRMVFHFYER